MNLQAFPHTPDRTEPTGVEGLVRFTPGQVPGMDLRDYFAAKALQGLLADLPKILYGPEWVKSTATTSYTLADAMLKAREAKPPARYCVDGCEFGDPQSSYAGDGQFPPFVIFDIEAQQNLPGHYATRAQAEAALAKVQP